jgi:hypothetical protein
MRKIEEKDYISKNKIREKIDKLKEDKYNVNTPHCSYWYNIKIETLLELLESEE